jgi:hypothetical protein
MKRILLATLLLISTQAAASDRSLIGQLNDYLTGDKTMQALINRRGGACASVTQRYVNARSSESASGIFSVACSDGNNYLVVYDSHDESNSQAVACSMIPLSAGVDCFKPYQERR